MVALDQNAPLLRVRKNKTGYGARDDDARDVHYDLHRGARVGGILLEFHQQKRQDGPDTRGRGDYGEQTRRNRQRSHQIRRALWARQQHANKPSRGQRRAEQEPDLKLLAQRLAQTLRRIIHLTRG